MLQSQNKHLVLVRGYPIFLDKINVSLQVLLMNPKNCYIKTDVSCHPSIFIGLRIVLAFFVGSGLGFFLGFLSWHHLPCIRNSLELESVILHGICYTLAWLFCILTGICYILAWLLCKLYGICCIWPCSPSILHGICHLLALQTFQVGFLSASLRFL